ncbi:uncharacterized protein LOC112351667 isoform X1 [Selaginella moellendorffii]|uniref:uncharacterized protein LOC112340802 n=1 Tax=Selaginella moellendorffii TaxID=88036 RepID=UPI000D1C3893|nr:uncharacterized protein LOC112340802 [Selaginella moellendorffii]XP_024545708.1 uncharacterized protein LOC112351667 isoform X1 [Selaginella moellendorffii]|eukprot:XP_024515598.1 uncharacterized protein LOC112340802 [Selaginella moellendorffii]
MNSASSSTSASIPQIDYSAPAARSSNVGDPNDPLFDDHTWRPCPCIQLDTRNQIRITIPASIQHKVREQRVAISLVIVPSVRNTPANVDVEPDQDPLGGRALDGRAQEQGGAGFLPLPDQILDRATAGRSQCRRDHSTRAGSVELGRGSGEWNTRNRQRRG